MVSVFAPKKLKNKVSLQNLKLLAFLFEKLLLEKDEDGHPNCDGRIGNVEYGPEKDEFISSPEREPAGIISFDDGEIEHVHHFAVQEAAVSAFLRERPGDLMEGAFTEDHAVKGTVDNVPQGPCQDQRYAQDKTKGFFLPGKFCQVPPDGDHCDDPENTQRDLPKIATEFHAEGHALIFGKMKNKPITQNSDFTPRSNEHTGLDPNLQDLISDQDKQNDDNRLFQCMGKEISKGICTIFFEADSTWHRYSM